MCIAINSLVSSNHLFRQYIMKESVLIQRLIDGSQKAFEDLYKMYSVQLLAFCLRYTKSRELSKDIVQEVFVKLWTNRQTIREHESLKALLFVMARNRLINSYRSTVNSPIYEQYLDFVNDSSISVTDTNHKIEYDDFCKKLNNVVSKMPKTQQEVFRYCKLEQFTNKETAEKLGLSEQTVKNQLTLIMKELRHQLLIQQLIVVLYSVFEGL